MARVHWLPLAEGVCLCRAAWLPIFPLQLLHLLRTLGLSPVFSCPWLAL